MSRPAQKESRRAQLAYHVRCVETKAASLTTPLHRFATMDHGPSELQLSLLMLAAQKRLAKVPLADAGMQSVDLTLTEALTELYGWKVHAGDPRKSGRQFCPEEIGVKRYNSVRGSVSKAFKRLELRGYVKRHGGVGQKWTGIVLNNAGLAAAKAMLEAGETPKKQRVRKSKRR